MTNFKFLDFLERIAYQLQLKYMKSKRTTETAAPNLIRFHPQSRGQKILKRYLTRCGEIL